MKYIDVEHEVLFKVGSFDEKAVVTANCTPTEEPNIYDIRVTVKAKNKNRRKIHRGQIEINDASHAIEDVKDYMDCSDIVKNMLSELSDALRISYPNIYIDVKTDEDELFLL